MITERSALIKTHDYRPQSAPEHQLPFPSRRARQYDLLVRSLSFCSRIQIITSSFLPWNLLSAALKSPYFHLLIVPFPIFSLFLRDIVKLSFVINYLSNLFNSSVFFDWRNFVEYEETEEEQLQKRLDSFGYRFLVYLIISHAGFYF